MSKLAAHWATVNYRESFDLFACSGILFNHESPLRGAEFVTQKIVLGLNNIKKGVRKYFHLGTLMPRDWGHASDYVHAMKLIMENNSPNDYVVATGSLYSVRDFVELAAKYFGFSIVWTGDKENYVWSG